MDKVYSWFSSAPSGPSNILNQPPKPAASIDSKESADPADVDMDMKEWSSVSKTEHSDNTATAGTAGTAVESLEDDEFDILTLGSEGTDDDRLGVLSLPSSTHSSPLPSPKAAGSPDQASARMAKLSHLGNEWKLSLLDSVLNNRYLEQPDVARVSPPLPILSSSSPSAPGGVGDSFYADIISMYAGHAGHAGHAGTGALPTLPGEIRVGNRSLLPASVVGGARSKKGAAASSSLRKKALAGDAGASGAGDNLPSWAEMEKLILQPSDLEVAKKEEQKALQSAQRKTKSFNALLSKAPNKSQSATGNASSAAGNRHKGNPRFFGSNTFTPVPRGATKNYRK